MALLHAPTEIVCLQWVLENAILKIIYFHIRLRNSKFFIYLYIAFLLNICFELHLRLDVSLYSGEKYLIEVNLVCANSIPDI